MKELELLLNMLLSMMLFHFYSKVYVVSPWSKIFVIFFSHESALSIMYVFNIKILKMKLNIDFELFLVSF